MNAKEFYDTVKAMREAQKEGESWYWFAEGNLSGVNLDDGDITHWMPLPQPPKKGDDQ